MTLIGLVCHALRVLSARLTLNVERSVFNIHGQSFNSNSYSPHERAFSAILAILSTFNLQQRWRRDLWATFTVLRSVPFLSPVIPVVWT